MRHRNLLNQPPPDGDQGANLPDQQLKRQMEIDQPGYTPAGLREEFILRGHSDKYAPVAGSIPGPEVAPFAGDGGLRRLVTRKGRFILTTRAGMPHARM